MSVFRPLRGELLAACMAASLLTLLAMTATMVWGASVSLAVSAEKYYEDARGNLCVGLEFPGGFPKESCAMKALTTGEFNTGVGQNALLHETTGFQNTATGYEALRDNTEGSWNVADGYQALYNNTTGFENTAVGDWADIGNTTGYGNTAFGYWAMRNSSGRYNLAIGGSTLEEASGESNVAIGDVALEKDTTGSGNVATGEWALQHNSTASSNTANGFGALYANTTGANNVAVGNSALINNKLGSNNVAIGSGAGSEITGSNNIDLSNGGLSGDTGVTRIGGEGAQTKAYVAGIGDTAVKGCSVQVTSQGQLGCNNNPEGSAVATYASTAAVTTGQCLYFTGRGAPGRAACPAATSGYSANKALSLAMPANGATVSNLAANTSATLTGSDTAVVEVIDNTTGASVLSCTVNSSTVNHCTNNASTGTAAALTKLEVRITTTGTSGASKDWEVTFRY